jgi:outer membrane protein OmpA-like peptidoglycan-associated protein
MKIPRSIQEIALKLLTKLYFLFFFCLSFPIQAQSEASILWKTSPIFWQHEAVQCLAIDAQNQKWVGTENGLYLIDNQGNTKEIYLDSTAKQTPPALGMVTALAFDKAQNVWLSRCEAEPKIWCRKKDGKWIFFNLKISNKFIHKQCLIKKIVIDFQDRKWLITDGAGLVLLEGKEGEEQLTYFSKENTSLKSNEVNDLLITQTGLTWVATDNGLFQVQEKQFFELAHWRKHRVHALALDKMGDLWIAATHKNTHFLYKNSKIIEKSNAITAQYFQLLPFQEGVYAMGKELHFYQNINSSKIKIFKNKNYKKNIAIPTKNSIAFQIDTKGNYWLASADKGLFSDVELSEKEAEKTKELLIKFNFDKNIEIKKGEEFTIDILFSKNSFDILPYSYAELEKLLKMLETYPTMRLQIQGHTSATVAEGDPNFNLNLSKERAQAVKTFLCERGISPERLETVGFGDSKPIDLLCPARNRRVSILIID